MQNLDKNTKNIHIEFIIVTIYLCHSSISSLEERNKKKKHLPLPSPQRNPPMPRRSKFSLHVLLWTTKSMNSKIGKKNLSTKSTSLNKKLRNSSLPTRRKKQKNTLKKQLVFKNKWKQAIIIFQSYTLRKKALIDKKFQLEQAAMDMDTIDAIDGAQVHIKNQEKYSEKLEELILDGQ